MAAAQRLTAVFRGSDILAAGAIRSRHEEGIVVPDEISIKGSTILRLPN